MNYISLFLTGLVTSLLVTPFVRDRAIRRCWLDMPNNGRHLHLRPVPRIGGVALFLAFASTTAIGLVVFRHFAVGPAVSLRTVCGIVAPCVLVFVTGLYDDLLSIGPCLKFGIEAVAAVALYASGFGIHQLDFYSANVALRISVGLPLTILWVLLVTNAFNLIDGLDGLAAGSALFSTLIIFAISLWRHSDLVSLLSAALAGAILGFLRYNFHPATIFLGDSGSLSIGFLLSALALAGSQKATTIVAVAIPVVAFGLPLLDVGLSVFRRFLSDTPLFQGDDEHIHHKLIKRGVSHRDAVLILYAVAATFGLLSLTLLHGETMLGIVLAVIGIGVCLGVHELKYLEIFELVSTFRRIRQRRQTIANNLRLRRAIEALIKGPADFPEICRVLQSTLEPIGFSAAGFCFPRDQGFDESMLLPLQQDEKGRHCHLWKDERTCSAEWELRLVLTGSTGSTFGDFFIFRSRAAEPLWVDIDLLNGAFRTAVSEAMNRAIRLSPLTTITPERPRALTSTTRVSEISRVSAD